MKDGGGGEVGEGGEVGVKGISGACRLECEIHISTLVVVVVGR